jgi:hypothetical protein
MRKRLVQLTATLLLLLVLPANPHGGGAAGVAANDPMPCDPPPTHWCEVRGGTFNYVTCRCEFP